VFSWRETQISRNLFCLKTNFPLRTNVSLLSLKFYVLSTFDIEVLRLSPQEKAECFYTVFSVLVSVTFSFQCVCPLFSQYIMDLRLVLWEIFFDVNIKAWISSGCERKKISSHSSVVKKYRAPLTKKSLVIIRSPFISQNLRKIGLLGEVIKKS
jgi:hypothetical protein